MFTIPRLKTLQTLLVGLLKITVRCPSPRHRTSAAATEQTPRHSARRPPGALRCRARFGSLCRSSCASAGGARRAMAPAPHLPICSPRSRPPMPIDIELPHNGWLPRPHQAGLWRYLQGGGTRAMAVWHRRAGKDEICLHHAAVSMMKRKGNYWHCLPEYSQARKAIWTAVNPHTGKRRIDEAFPEALRENTNDHEMFIRMCGSTWQLIGSDRFDATVGSGVAGITYSEWALANPSAWAYHRPMVEENNGWAAFITTPRGRNHAKAMFDHASKTPNWFCERLTALDTKTLSATQLQEALEEYQALYGQDVGSAQFQQEYMCDWHAAILGAFYALEMATVRNEGRVTDIEAIPDEP